MKSLDRKRAAMTEAFVKAVETAGKWLPDWICTRPRNFLTGKAYRGINNVMLPIRAMIHGWEAPLFAGKGQIKGADHGEGESVVGGGVCRGRYGNVRRTGR